MRKLVFYPLPQSRLFNFIKAPSGVIYSTELDEDYPIFSFDAGVEVLKDLLKDKFSFKHPEVTQIYKEMREADLAADFISLGIKIMNIQLPENINRQGFRVIFNFDDSIALPRGGVYYHRRLLFRFNNLFRSLLKLNRLVEKGLMTPEIAVYIFQEMVVNNVPMTIAEAKERMKNFNPVENFVQAVNRIFRIFPERGNTAPSAN
ncbi:MAG: hypothetical protein UT86_C0006G0026 [Candidatus Magasanikbacteria bacterium GW2011_GWC2_40_17]|uniref:Uncharacterized protein n=1 Tax=Candidatus Magasanikbacteria bacterium GW2011_GWA2_42_32 TaxID=1619039 RepID=A0A0G1A6L5_9BACT|nr:MAG: hypothetical protein UT86_C0006G0026 [Candidatus Magasanikbacteria bacterium GW2011_GWC2_40_17]KKS56650.1 MAG: hypothetical protein UV20_C0008G0026 [Candidatus Magasanikbacteria bacterium GW2011_GWA2_42_32]OGH86085.1 MAG: hypothetical protein A2294_04045 [Candidatus Magasanikbacteria bacterium RIFOXYB2_FULL_38_10]